jgi:hypothetical protein
MWRVRALAARLSPERLYRGWTGLRFDLRYSADTNRVVEIGDVGTYSDQAQRATRYRATSVGFLQYLFKRIPVDHASFDFIDLGSGKGRVLVEAAAYPFHSVVGVEFSRRLHLAAERLVATFEAQHTVRAPIELRCMSATECGAPSRDTMYYLYNPFDATILSEVMVPIRLALARDGIRIVIIYLNPRWSEVIERAPGFRLIDAGRFGPDDYRVYATS